MHPSSLVNFNTGLLHIRIYSSNYVHLLNIHIFSKSCFRGKKTTQENLYLKSFTGSKIFSGKYEDSNLSSPHTIFVVVVVVFCFLTILSICHKRGRPHPHSPLSVTPQ